MSNAILILEIHCIGHQCFVSFYCFCYSITDHIGQPVLLSSQRHPVSSSSRHATTELHDPGRRNNSSVVFSGIGGIHLSWVDVVCCPTASELHEPLQRRARRRGIGAQLGEPLRCLATPLRHRDFRQNVSCTAGRCGDGEGGTGWADDYLDDQRRQRRHRAADMRAYVRCLQQYLGNDTQPTASETAQVPGTDTPHSRRRPSFPVPGRVVWPPVLAQWWTIPSSAHSHRTAAVPMLGLPADVQPQRQLDSTYENTHGRETVNVRSLWSLFLAQRRTNTSHASAQQAGRPISRLQIQTRYRLPTIPGPVQQWRRLVTIIIAPCGLPGCKNRHTPFPDRR